MYIHAPTRYYPITHNTRHVSSQLTFFSLCHAQGQVEALEDRVKEKEQLNTQLRSALEAVQDKQTADIGTQSPIPPEPEEPVFKPATTATTTAAAAAIGRPNLADNMTTPIETTQKPIPVATKVRGGGADSGVIGGGGGSKRFPKERIRSPIRRGVRSHSPRTSLGDLLDSSLDNEMRVAGFEVNDSFDSSEGVGLSDTNLDVSVMESDHSLATREEVGGGGVAGAEGHEPLRKPSHRMAWEEEQVDQAQASDRGKEEVGGGKGVADGQGVLTNLVDGIRSGVGEREELTLSGTSEGDVVASSRDKGQAWVWAKG